MTGWQDHLLVAPVLLPLAAAALLMLFGEQRRRLKAAINVVATLGLLVVATLLLLQADGTNTERAAVYLLGNWPAPFGIVLVLDRLAALMVLLAAVVALAGLVFSLARWHRAGAHYHSLFQFMLVGLNGAFLTGDLFNLFVFFEVLLTASYGLLLHGSGRVRVKAGLRYVVVNLASSLLFLLGVAVIYGVTGTLNMADLAQRMPGIAASDLALLRGGIGVLGVAFLVKAGMWPLSFWLTGTYAAASAPVAAIFALMTKVGVYVILRLWMLLHGAAEDTQFGHEWLLVGGLMTILFGTLGALASQSMARLAGSCVLISSGTLLAVIGHADARVTAGALYYLVSSTLAIAAFFLLIELAERGRRSGADVLAVTLEAFGDKDDELPGDDEEIGAAMPATMALLGLGFVACALLLAGLPPLSGFLAKFVLLSALMGESGAPLSLRFWGILLALLVSSLAALIALTRAGMRAFWIPLGRQVPRVRVIEMMPVLTLLALTVILTVQAGAAMRYMHEAAQALHAPLEYRDRVLSAPQTGAAMETLP